MRLRNGILIGLLLVSTAAAQSFPPPSDVPYGASWNGNRLAATKNALYDKIEAVLVGAIDPILQGIITAAPAADQMVFWTGPATCDVVYRVPWRNVRDDGAAGNGAADDTAEIQASITAVEAAGGGIVYLPAGTYKLSSALAISADDVYLYAQGDATLTLANGSNCNVIELASGVERLTIDGLRFDGNGANQTGTLYFVRGNSNLHDITVRNCYFEDLRVGGIGLYFYYAGSSRLRFLNNTYGPDARCGPFVIGADDVEIRGHWATAGEANIEFADGRHLVLSDFAIDANTWNPGEGVSGRQQMVIIGGVGTTDCNDTNDVTITNGQITGALGDCLWIGTASRVTVSNVVIRNDPNVATADCCISLNGCDDVTITGCDLSQAGTAGIAIDHAPGDATIGSENILIANNNIHRCGVRTDVATNGYRNGILIQGYSQRVTIVGNNLLFNDEWGIRNLTATGCAEIRIAANAVFGNPSGTVAVGVSCDGVMDYYGDQQTNGAWVAMGPVAAVAANRVYLDTDGGGASRLIATGPDAATAGTLNVHVMASDGGPDYDAWGIGSDGVISIPYGLRLPHGAALAMTAEGHVTYDTTDGVLVVRDESGDKVLADPNLHFSVTIVDDGDWNNEALPIWQAPNDKAVTIKSVRATAMGTTPTLTYNIEERAWAGLASAGTDIYGSDQAADADGEIETAFSNASIAAGAHLVFTTGAGAETNTVTLIQITVYYQEDRE